MPGVALGGGRGHLPLFNLTRGIPDAKLDHCGSCRSFCTCVFDDQRGGEACPGPGSPGDCDACPGPVVDHGRDPRAEGRRRSHQLAKGRPFQVCGVPSSAVRTHPRARLRLGVAVPSFESPRSETRSPHMRNLILAGVVAVAALGCSTTNEAAKPAPAPQVIVTPPAQPAPVIVEPAPKVIAVPTN
jgi:hypothetical protein